MRHEPPNSFHGTPRGTRGTSSEAQLAAKLYGELRPLEQARDNSIQIGDDPHGLAGLFTERAKIARSRELGIVRAEALGAVDQEIDDAGLIAPAVAVAEAAQLAEQTTIRAEGVQVEQNKNAVTAIETRQVATAGYEAWCHESGARRRHTPWPILAMTLFVIACAGFVEMCVMAAILAGPPIQGVPTGYVLGILFAFTSVMVGILGAAGISLLADLRHGRKILGAIALLVTIAVWTSAAVAGAHLRAVIEAGGGGSVDEIIASMAQGLWRPFASPLALFLVGASAVAAAVAWIKWGDHVGTPFGHRGKDLDRLHTEAALHLTEQEHREAVVAVIRQGLSGLDTLEAKAWQPANNGERLERELSVIVAQARECMTAVDRITRGIIADYVAATRRLRAGVDVSADMELASIADEGIGDPQSFRAKVEQLTTGARIVSEKVATCRAELQRCEVDHLRSIDRLYGVTRPSRPASNNRHTPAGVAFQPGRN